MVGFVLTTLLLSACEFMSYSDFGPDAYDGALLWEEVNSDAEWENRYDHAATVFNGQIWLFGGYNPGRFSGDTYLEDVWKSGDGESWDLVLEKAPWNGRRGHQVVSFNDGTGEALYLIGGFEVDESSGYRQYTNDVWKSSDGADWEQIKARTEPLTDSIADWTPRMEHSCQVINRDGTDYIYLFAGRTMQEHLDGRFATVYFNDVWRSRNGKDWEAVGNNDFGIRGDQAFALNPHTGRMYIQGGTHGFTFTPPAGTTHPIENWQYLWYSDDGEKWEAVNDTSTFDQSLLWRSSHQMLWYRDVLWGLPGKTVSNEHYQFAQPEYFPIWRYEEFNQWSVDSYGAAFDPRHGYAALVFEDKIWILGGFTSNSGQDNDVWTGEIKP